MALQLLGSRSYTEYDGAQIKTIIEEAKGEWIKIGEYKGSSKLDSKASIQIGNNGLEAHLTLTPPLLSGKTLDLQDIEALLKERGIVYGIDKQKIQETLDAELFNIPILIATGTKPIPGQDSKIQFYFTQNPVIQLKEQDFGRVDFFGELGLLNSVQENQLLATKIPEKKGVPGKNIFGEAIPTKNGKDIPFGVLENATLSDDKLQIFSKKAGRALYKDGSIGIKTVYEVKKDIDTQTGSITFLGDIIIRGNINDGFTVKAMGNIYVAGTIGKATVESEGDIYTQGILGKGGGLVQADGSIIAKFVENAHLKAKKKVISYDGILHSVVKAKCIFSLGKHGIITGGHVSASEEINAKVIGSAVYTETKIEVGFDPESKEKLMKLEEKKLELENNLNRIIPNITTLQKQKISQKDTFSEKREKMLNQLFVAQKHIEPKLESLYYEIEELKTYLNQLLKGGKLSALEKIYPGTEINIRNVILKLKTEHAKTTFVLESGEIKPYPYQPTKDQQAIKSNMKAHIKKTLKHK